MRTLINRILSFALISFLLSACSAERVETSEEAITPAFAKETAKEAWLYGYPIFYNYRTQYLYALDQSYPDNIGFNEFKNYGKSFTYADTSVVTPNNDTPYSWAILDLSDEPIIVEVPQVDDDRYYVLQLVDLYTFNFAYIGSRTTGNSPGKYMIAGPEWSGESPQGIDSIFHSETNLVTILGRIELENQEDMPNVVEIQNKFGLTPLHEFNGNDRPANKSYAMPLPKWNESDFTSIAFINVLNSLLQYASIDESEKQLREDFAKIGIRPGETFDSAAYSPEIIAAIKEGVIEGEKTLKSSIDKTTSSLHLFGTRRDLNNNYVSRATAAAMGLFGNTKEEAVYEGSMLDNSGAPLMGDQKYELKFAKEQLPEVEFFWSITMYNLPNRYLVKNPIDRYSIGDRTKGLKFESNGDLIIYMQSTSPGAAKESNWLPTPEQGPFNYVVRMYGPGESIIAGEWKQPLPQKID